MNIKKSFDKARAEAQLKTEQIAERMGIKRQTLSTMVARSDLKASTIQRMADAFGMKASEFIALGED